MYKLFRLLNTIKYLKLSQIYFRLYRKFIKLAVMNVHYNVPRKRSSTWIKISLYDSKIDLGLNTEFLNSQKILNLPNDWNNKNITKLWVYNLHYFDDLLSHDAFEKHDLHLTLLTRWVNDNKIGYGVGWEPYPSSLRIVNILKAWLGGLELNDKLFKSVHDQTNYLCNNLEKHLLGNHYFVNLKAILFAGVVFENSEWIWLAQKELINQINEQILDDGFHFELSPMYHSLIIVDLFDILNLNNAYPHTISISLIETILDKIPQMIKCQEAMSHPDESVSFFNDSVDGIAPKKKIIDNYGKKLGFPICKYQKNYALEKVDNFSGYICAEISGNKLIFDAADVGAVYIPAHAHADTLSFELSIGKQRVFVNSGTSEYENNLRRLSQRKTKSHNTVEIDELDSSLVWDSFRVADRAKVSNWNFQLFSEKVMISAEHNGYTKLFNKRMHKRLITFDTNTLIVNDYISGKYKNAVAYYYFHPNIIISEQNNIISFKGENFSMQCDLRYNQYKILDTLWSPQFGLNIANKCLCIDIIENNVKLKFTWIKYEI